MIFPLMILSLFEGHKIKTFCSSVGFFLVYTVLTIRQDMMDQTDENTDKQIKVP